jgi:DNA-binding NtrC family response regulator
VSSDAETANAGVDPASPSGLSLVVACGGTTRTLPLPSPPCTLTLVRADDNAVVLDDPSISRKHALLHLSDTGLHVEDLGARNGVFVGQLRLQPRERAPIAPGTLLRIGDAMLTIQGSALIRAAGAKQNPGPSPMQSVLATLDQVAASDLSVMLLGETGVGKEVAAVRVHEHSQRAKGPLVRVSCAAFPDNLLEAELFGYERGAFTGAMQAKAGLFEAGHGGTVFLDEIGEVSLSTQAKLLRVIEAREVQRLGALRPKPIDVRFVSATHRDVAGMVAAGTFREDLFFRLNGISVTLPPLRQRTDEILPLATAFARGTDIGAEAKEALIKHPWPGNVRELRNVMERAVVLSGGRRIESAHLQLAAPPARKAPPTLAAQPPGSDGSDERARIIAALEACAGNQTSAARLLGMSRRTLIYKLDELDIPRPRKRT